MKVVINACFGGFSLSALATKRYFELKGRPCYFFVNPRKPELDISKYVPISLEKAEKDFMWYAFDTPNVDDFADAKDWREMTTEERKISNDKYSAHSLSNRDISRTDPHLVQLVEELGDKANGRCADLSVVEVPDGVEWEIGEYDGRETVEEKHRSWR